MQEEVLLTDAIARPGPTANVRPVPWIWGKNPTEKKVYREVLRDKGGNTGEMLPFTE